MAKIVSEFFAGRRRTSGRRMMLKISVSGYAKCGVKWKNASMRAPRGKCDRRTRRKSFRCVCTVPTAQRNCCARKALMSSGNSAGVMMSSRYTNFQPRSWRPVAEIEVLGQRVVLPTAGVGDRRLAPDAAGAGEVEEPAGGVAHAVLDQMVPVEHERRNARENGVRTVDMPPACLDHRDLRVVEVRKNAAQERGRRNEVGVEESHELALGHLGGHAASAPALYPTRSSRWRRTMSRPVSQSASTRRCASSPVVSSVESSRT